MKKLFAVLGVVIALSGCGYTSRDNDLIGQIKKVQHATPLICPNYDQVDVSLGVMRNGVGSMSQEDIWMYVPDETVYQQLKALAVSGTPVKVIYDSKRFRWCVPEEMVISVEAVK